MCVCAVLCAMATPEAREYRRVLKPKVFLSIDDSGLGLDALLKVSSKQNMKLSPGGPPTATDSPHTTTAPHSSPDMQSKINEWDPGVILPPTHPEVVRRAAMLKASAVDDESDDASLFEAGLDIQQLLLGSRGHST